MSLEKNIEFSCPAKAILVGEHSVLYGYSAIATPLPDLRLTLKRLPKDSNHIWFQETQREGVYEPILNGYLDSLNFILKKCLSLLSLELSTQKLPFSILLSSKIPLGAGLGSSAAFSVSLVKLVAKHFNIEVSDDEVLHHSKNMEDVHHGKSSGLDIAVIAKNRLVSFTMETGVSELTVPKSFWVAVVDTLERSSTASMVQKVKDIQEESRNKLMQSLGEITEKAKDALLGSEIGFLGKLLDEAHSYLADLGLSTAKIEEVVCLLRQDGALGAKLTGSGGGGVCIGVFLEKPKLAEVKKRNFPYYLSNVMG